MNDNLHGLAVAGVSLFNVFSGRSAGFSQLKKVFEGNFFIRQNDILDRVTAQPLKLTSLCIMCDTGYFFLRKFHHCFWQSSQP